MGWLDLEAAWYGHGSALGRIVSAGLMPLSLAYRVGQAAHAGAQRPERVDRPVVSVGNLTVGGSGKTPLVIALVELLEASGLKVAVISRGYGRASKGTRVVRVPGGQPPDAATCGDEPALIALRCPNAAVVVGEDRVDAARLAIQTWAPDVLVCDDAFQHRRLARDLDLVAIHAGRGFGNRRLLPAGPLREPVDALERASMAVFTHCRGLAVDDLRQRHRLPEDLPAVGCGFEAAGLVTGPGLAPVPGPPPGRVVAACAIADPDGFFGDLQASGLEVVDRFALPDHRRLGPRQFARLAEAAEAQRADAVLVTEKDLIKIDQAPKGLRLLAVRLEARWNTTGDREAMAARLAEAMA